MDLYNLVRPRNFEDMFPTSKCIATFPKRIDEYLSKRVPGTKDESLLANNYIFHSAEPGLGKTTTGRIFASMINQHISDDEREAIFTGQDNPVFKEINGGNFRKIDDLRALEEEITYRGDSLFDLNYVYMINEAHNITPNAQELMLDMTENTPGNVFIILTTTKMNSLNDKLRSRFEKHQFKPLDKPYISRLIKETVKQIGEQPVRDDIIDAMYSHEGGSPRNILSALSNYLGTKSYEPVEEEEEGKQAYFKEYIESLEKVAEGGKQTWIRVFAPRVQSMINDVPVEELRLKMLRRLASVVLDKRSFDGKGSYKKALLYESLYELFSLPVGIPQKSDMILRLFKAYMLAKSISLEGRVKSRGSDAA